VTAKLAAASEVDGGSRPAIRRVWVPPLAVAPAGLDQGERAAYAVGTWHRRRWVACRRPGGLVQCRPHGGVGGEPALPMLEQCGSTRTQTSRHGRPGRSSCAGRCIAHSLDGDGDVDQLGCRCAAPAVGQARLVRGRGLRHSLPAGPLLHYAVYGVRVPIRGEPPSFDNISLHRICAVSLAVSMVRAFEDYHQPERRVDSLRVYSQRS
jgi:hypothetical protein